MKKSIKLGMLVLPLTFSTTAICDSSMWSLGVGAIFSPAVYKGTPANTVVIPLIGDQGEHLYLDGFGAGYHLYPDGSLHNIVLRVQYDPRTLQPNESSDPDIRLLDKRKSTVLGGVTYEYLTHVGVLSASIATDIGGAHNGYYADLAWHLPIYGAGWGITPSFGFGYNSQRLNQYYYGVSESESARTGGRIAPFEADWDGQYFIGLSGYAMLSRTIRVNGGVKYSSLEGKLSESPIIESTNAFITDIGISYLF